MTLDRRKLETHDLIMELRSLRYLLAVAEKGHFTRAAERFFVSQPALSQQIRKLEEELGEVLLERSVTPVQLTEAGTVGVAYARWILAELETMRMALDELQGLQRGDLMVGAVQTVQAYLIPYAVATFTRSYSGIRLQVLELPADEVEAGVLAGRFQLGLSFVPLSPGDLVATPLFDEELVLIVPPNHALAAEHVVSVGLLAQTPLALLPVTYCTRRLWDRWAQAAGLQPVVILEMNTIEGLLQVVRRLGVATVLPELTLRLETARTLRAVRLLEPSSRRTVGVRRHQGAPISKAAQTFEAVLQGWSASVWNGWAATA